MHVFKEACGYWTKDRFRPLIGALMNLCLNIITIRFIGLYGVILSTVFEAVTIDLIWAPKAIFAEYFKKSRREYYRLLAGCGLDLFCMGIPTCLITSLIRIDSHLLSFFVKAIVCAVVPNIVFMLKNYKKPEFAAIKIRLKKLLRIA